MAFTSPLVLVHSTYKPDLTTSIYFHEFYYTLTASTGTFMTSTVTRTASVCTLTAFTGTLVASNTVTAYIGILSATTTEVGIDTCK